MGIIEETKQHLKQLSKEYQNLSKNHPDHFELKSLELAILQTESQLRNLGVDF